MSARRLTGRSSRRRSARSRRYRAHRGLALRLVGLERLEAPRVPRSLLVARAVVGGRRIRRRRVRGRRAGRRRAGRPRTWERPRRRRRRERRLVGPGGEGGLRHGRSFIGPRAAGRESGRGVTGRLPALRAKPRVGTKFCLAAQARAANPVHWLPPLGISVGERLPRAKDFARTVTNTAARRCRGAATARPSPRLWPDRRPPAEPCRGRRDPIRSWQVLQAGDPWTAESPDGGPSRKVGSWTRPRARAGGRSTAYVSST